VRIVMIVRIILNSGAHRRSGETSLANGAEQQVQHLTQRALHLFRPELIGRKHRAACWKRSADE